MQQPAAGDLGFLQGPIGILGFGVEGRSTARFLLERGMGGRGDPVYVFDQREPQGLGPGLVYAGDGEEYLARLPEMGTVFRSAGIRPDLPEILAFRKKGGLLTSQIELFFRLAGRRRIIGVTGTLGKGTCCSILKAMFDAAGKPCRLGGNIGVAALDLLDSLGPEETVLLELSSFQLSTLSESPARAALLRTTVEHLDWHLSVEEYWDHKANIAAHQGPEDFLVYCGDAEGSRRMARRSGARKRRYGRVPEARSAFDSSDARDAFGPSKTRVTSDPASHSESSEAGDASGPSDASDPSSPEENRIEWGPWGLRFPKEGIALRAGDLKLPGLFNLENVAAALALALESGIEAETAVRAAQAFAGLEHRLEWVRRFEGIDFFNDSYATRPEAVIGALETFAGRPLGLILGGSEKFTDFSALAEALAAYPGFLAIGLIGQTAPRLRTEIEAALARADRSSPPSGKPPAGSPLSSARGGLFLHDCRDLDQCLEILLPLLASPQNRDGRPVFLLSPGCASFGLFANYKERGRIFKEKVRAL